MLETGRGSSQEEVYFFNLPNILGFHIWYLFSLDQYSGCVLQCGMDFECKIAWSCVHPEQNGLDRWEPVEMSEIAGSRSLL